MKFKGNATKFLTDFEKILYACAYLRGRALDWAEPYINGKPGYIFQDLAEFYQRLEDTFSDPNPQATAEQKLQQCYQGTQEMSAYYTNFQNIINLLELDNHVKIMFFHNSICEKVKELLVR